MEELKTIIDHTKNLYDLIDTSIKIGLSSIITGLISTLRRNSNWLFEYLYNCFASYQCLSPIEHI